MKTLVNHVKNMSVKSRRAGHCVDFLDHQLSDPACRSLIQRMNSIDINELGISGTDAAADPYHFQSALNRVTIEGNEDYRLVMFFIKKGTEMPLHDHPNMSVYFKLMFGSLEFQQYDKADSKYRYNQLSNDEYDELIETKARIPAKKHSLKLLNGKNLLLVRPSCGNLHKFVAKEDSCFFDICLPNYTQDSLRRITYFNEVAEHISCDHHKGEDDAHHQKHVAVNGSCENSTLLEYHTTPPVLPVGFDISELAYRGSWEEHQKIHARL